MRDTRYWLDEICLVCMRIFCPSVNRPVFQMFLMVEEVKEVGLGLCLPVVLCLHIYL